MPHRSLQLSDRDLLQECTVHCYRASGPGGQKRNKIESAVRLVHRPTELSAIAEDSRSQHSNRRIALQRLREQIALNCRNPVEIEVWQRPEQFDESGGVGARMNDQNPSYPFVIAILLDVLESTQGKVAPTARLLSVSTGRLVSFLSHHPRLWQVANQIRTNYELSPLRHPR